MRPRVASGILVSLTAGMISIVPFAFALPDAIPMSFEARIVDRKDRTKVLYRYSHRSSKEGDIRSLQNRFATLDGDEIATESAELEGARVKRYRQIHKQVGSEGSVEVRDGEVHFTLTRDGKTSKSVEKWKDNFVVGPSLLPYLRTRWDEVVAGKSIDVRLGVVDRRETVGFTLKKTADIEFEGKKAFVVKMRATSFIISALVDPLYFTIDAEKGLVLQLEGRVVPKRRVDGKWKDLDAVTLYEYP